MTSRLRLLPVALLGVMILLGTAASAVSQEDTRSADIIDLSGLWDERIIRFAIDSIEAAAESGTVEYVVLAIDSRGVVSGADELAALAALVADPPLPVVTWVGEFPARAYGGVAQVALAADVALAAPDAEVGYLEPTIAGDAGSAPVVDIEATVAARLTPPSERMSGDVDTGMVAELLSGMTRGTVDVAESGLFDEVGPSTAAPRQVGQFLDGVEVATANGPVVLSTVRDFEGGTTNLETVIREPGAIDQFLRLAATPEAAFFFLVAGLTVAAFEFYAIGPGIAAGTAAVSLLLAGYGLAVLPVRWWAVALTVVAVQLMAWSYQRGGIFLFTVVGIAALAVAGFSFTDAAPQIRPGAPGVLLTIAAAAFFFLMAMPTVARSRFSTQTIGREQLVGRSGRAVSELAPDGEVEVDGAVWRATSHREAGIAAGDAVEVLGVDGWFLEVDTPAASAD